MRSDMMPRAMARRQRGPARAQEVGEAVADRKPPARTRCRKRPARAGKRYPAFGACPAANPRATNRSSQWMV
jgi:hypothetical protein